MTHHIVLIIVSLLSILLMTFHHVDDIARGMASGGVMNFEVVLILIIWLYGTLMFRKRRAD